MPFASHRTQIESKNEAGNDSSQHRFELRLRSRALVTVGVICALGVMTSSCSASRSSSQAAGDGIIRISAERELMGTRFRIDVVVDDQNQGEWAIDAAFAEVSRSEEILSNWSDTSQISAVNRAAGAAPVAVSDELVAVLDRALYFSDLTDGAFDITFASCDGLWSVRERRVPTAEEIAACLPHVDYRRVALDRGISAVYLADAHQRIGIAGIAKGFRIDRAAAVLEARGISEYVIDGGGDMRISTPGGRRSWKIALEHPRRLEHALGTIEIASGAVATSGDYQWYFERNGVRYHHIIDPTTGFPARRSVSSTVIAETAVDADALATGLFVMGPERGIALAQRLPGVEALIIDSDLVVHATSGFPEFVNNEDLSS